MGEQPAEWGQQGGNRTLKAFFMLHLFLPTLKTHTRTLRSRPLLIVPENVSYTFMFFIMQLQD